MKDWLFNSDPYFMAYEVIPTYLASIILLYTLQPTRGPFFPCSICLDGPPGMMADQLSTFQTLP